MFVGDAMEDLPTFTPASLACRYFCQEGDDPEATPNVSRDRASDWGAHCRFDPGSARQLASSCGRVAGYGLAGGRRFWRVAMPAP